jgi:hypothetical protein
MANVKALLFFHVIYNFLLLCDVYCMTLISCWLVTNLGHLMQKIWRRHLWTNTCNFKLMVLVILHVSDLYKSIDFTWLIFRCNFEELIWATTSSSVLLPTVMMLPRYYFHWHIVAGLFPFAFKIKQYLLIWSADGSSSG